MWWLSNLLMVSWQIFNSSHSDMLHLHLSIWRKLSPELWLEEASPLPPHQSLQCLCPLTTSHLSPYSPTACPGYPPASETWPNLHPDRNPDAESLATSHTRGSTATSTLIQHWLGSQTRLWPLLKPKLSNWFDSGNTVCFSYHSLVISMLLKGSIRYVFISSNPCLSPPQKVP